MQTRGQKHNVRYHIPTAEQTTVRSSHIPKRTSLSMARVTVARAQVPTTFTHTYAPIINVST